MIEEQKMINIEKDALINKVSELRDAGYRLTQMGCNSLEQFEVIYSFEKDYEFLSLKLTLPREVAEIPSVSGIFWNAFLYENEIHDLFGIRVEGIALDYKGNFYRLAQRFPFSAASGPKEGAGQ